MSNLLYDVIYYTPPTLLPPTPLAQKQTKNNKNNNNSTRRCITLYIHSYQFHVGSNRLTGFRSRRGNVLGLNRVRR